MLPRRIEFCRVTYDSRLLPMYMLEFTMMIWYYQW